MPWDGSTRSARLPPDWDKRRARVLRNSPTCQRCETRPPVEVDHVTPGDDHSLANLQALCTSCHRAKTAAEGVAARGPRPTRRRSTEPHPGLTP